MWARCGDQEFESEKSSTPESWAVQKEEGKEGTGGLPGSQPDVYIYTF